jgi:hypothetical protein
MENFKENYWKIGRYAGWLFLCLVVVVFSAGCLEGEAAVERAGPQYVCGDGTLVQNPADCPVQKTVQVKETVNAQASETKKTTATEPASKETKTEAPAASGNCRYVASAGSTKYHEPDCRFAQRIKPENKICFGSKAEAEAQGYEPCGTCKP